MPEALSESKEDALSFSANCAACSIPSSGKHFPPSSEPEVSCLVFALKGISDNYQAAVYMPWLLIRHAAGSITASLVHPG